MSYDQLFNALGTCVVACPTLLLAILGVSSLVLGATVLILIALAHQSVRAPRAHAKAARSDKEAVR